jgi:hypothetical protein
VPTLPVYARHRAFKAPFALNNQSIIYFELYFEEDNADDDYQNNLEEIKENDPEKYNFLMSYFPRRKPNRGYALHQLEEEAIKAALRLFSPLKMGNEGHNNWSDLIMWISVNSYADVEKVEEVLAQNHTGGEDDIYIGLYFQARDFRLYPQGINGPFFGPDYHSNRHDYQGEIWEWLGLHKHVRNKKP